MASAGVTWSDSRASSTRSSPRFQSLRRWRWRSGRSPARGVQPAGWSGEIVSFHDRTESKRPRSRSKPSASSRAGVVSGTAALLVTRRIRRSAGAKAPLSSAAASVTAP
ncbi:hypothetical protein STANM309S_00101 [Streptomyces tanashiensis]